MIPKERKGNQCGTRHSLAQPNVGLAAASNEPAQSPVTIQWKRHRRDAILLTFVVMISAAESTRP